MIGGDDGREFSVPSAESPTVGIPEQVVPYKKFKDAAMAGSEYMR